MDMRLVLVLSRSKAAQDRQISSMKWDPFVTGLEAARRQCTCLHRCGDESCPKPLA